MRWLENNHSSQKAYECVVTTDVREKERGFWGPREASWLQTFSHTGCVPWAGWVGCTSLMPLPHPAQQSLRHRGSCSIARLYPSPYLPCHPWNCGFCSVCYWGEKGPRVRKVLKGAVWAVLMQGLQCKGHRQKRKGFLKRIAYRTHLDPTRVFGVPVWLLEVTVL